MYSLVAMGVASSVADAYIEEHGLREPLLEFIRSLDSPEQALLNEDALALVDVDFGRFHVPGSELALAAREVNDGTMVAEGEIADGEEAVATGKDGEVDDPVNAHLRAEQEALFSESMARLSGREEAVIPYLYVQLLFRRRLIVLEHVRTVLLERKSRPGQDAFFSSSDTLPMPLQKIQPTPPLGADSTIPVVARTLVNRSTSEFGFGTEDLSLKIISSLCTSALVALQALGKEVAAPVVRELREMLAIDLPRLNIGSLRSSSLDETMDFLLETYDEDNSQTEALEALCMLAIGRGSVYHLLQTAHRLVDNEQLTSDFRTLLLSLLDKTTMKAAFDERSFLDDGEYKLKRKAISFRWQGIRNEPTDASTDDGESRGGELGADDESDDLEEEADDIELQPDTSSMWLVESEAMRRDLGVDERGVYFAQADLPPALVRESIVFRSLGARVTQLIGSKSHVLFICQDGLAYAMGDNTYGQCGRASMSALDKPLQVDLGQPVRQAAAGDHHSLFLMQDGVSLYSCGRNQFGQLGLGHRSTSAVPHRMDFSSSQLITSISAAGSHSVAVLGDNEIHGCGLVKGQARSSMILLFCCDGNSRLVDVSSSSQGFAVALEEAIQYGYNQYDPKRRRMQPAGGINPPRIGVKRRRSQYRVFTCLVERSDHSRASSSASPTPSLTSSLSGSALDAAVSDTGMTKTESSGAGNANTVLTDDLQVTNVDMGSSSGNTATTTATSSILTATAASQDAGHLKSATVFHAHSSLQLLAVGDRVLVLVDDADTSTAIDAVPSSPRSKLQNEADLLRQYPYGMEPGAAIILWSLQRFPLGGSTTKFEIARILLALLERLEGHPTLMISALRVLQRHCFVTSSLADDEQVTMRDMKQLLFTLARGPDSDVKEEAIRAIGNGFAFLSPSATELATFMSTITNMTYLSKFATFRFWSELLAQDQQGTAMILIERLVDLACQKNSRAEVLNLLLAMQRSLLLCGTVEIEVINCYTTALCKASVKIINDACAAHDDPKAREEALADSILKSLTWPCMTILHYPSIELKTSVPYLVDLLQAVDRVCTPQDFHVRTWLADLAWAILLLILEKECRGAGNRPPSSSGEPGDAVDSANGGSSAADLTNGPSLTPNEIAAADGSGVIGMSTETDPADEDASATKEINMSIFNSGFVQTEELESRRVQFQAIVSDSEHEIMGKVSKMNKMKFRNKPGAEKVWEALRAVYAAISIFDEENAKTDAMQTAMKVLRWMNQTKQALPEIDYSILGSHVVERVLFLMQMKLVSDHSLFQFAQQFDTQQLVQYYEVLEQQKASFEQMALGLQVLCRLLGSLRSSVDLRRHVIFAFVDFTRRAKMTNVTRTLVGEAVNAMLRTRNMIEDRNPVLTTAILDACVATGELGHLEMVQWLLDCVSLESAADIVKGLQPLGEPMLGRDAQSLLQLPFPEGLPQSLGIQWSREHKHPGLRLSKNGLCFHLPMEVTANSCQTAATIRLSHSLFAGRYYFELACTPGQTCPESALLYAIGLVTLDYCEWDGFSSILCATLAHNQRVGLFVDMDASVCMVFRHEDHFYNYDTSELILERDSMISKAKIRSKIRPLCPAVSVLSPGATLLLKQVVIESSEVHICVDSEAKLPMLVRATLSGPSNSVGEASEATVTRIEDMPRVELLHRRSNSQLQGSTAQTAQSNEEDSGPTNSNPEQNNDDDDAQDKPRLTFTGPLNPLLSEETELLVCGQNSYGELGVGDTKPHKDIRTSEVIKHLFPVQVVAGNEVTGVLTAQGEVFVWGYNKNGACSKPSTTSATPQYGIPSPELTGSTWSGRGSTRSVSGSVSSLATAVSAIAANSNNEHAPPTPPPSSVSANALMRHHESPRVNVPRRIAIPAFVTRICCSNGSEHMLAITSSGHLYGWGFNQYGQLGLGHKYEKIYVPSRVEGALRDKQVTLAATSYSHSLALTSDGTLYAFGLNTRGQLGIGSTADMWTLPQRLNHLADVGRASSMACGVEHSAVVMENGSLYTFGRNDYGQLGIDDPNRQLSALPVRVEDGLSKLRSLHCEAVACGYYFTVVIADGTLHAFGINDFGQLGLGHNYEVYAPVPVLWDSGDDRFVAVTCGTGHSLAATTYGRIIAWGRNKDGGLGNGSTVDLPFPVEICNRGEFSLSLRDQRPLHLAAGFHHTCILVGPRQKSTGVSSATAESALADFGPTAMRLSTGLTPQLDTLWYVRASRASALTLRHMLRLDDLIPDDAVDHVLDWLLRLLRTTYHAIVVGKRFRRSSVSHLTKTSDEERRDEAITGWIRKLRATNIPSRSLYINFVLQLLLDVVKRRPFAREIITRKRRWAVDTLFDVAFSVGSPVRSGLAFEILSFLLPCVPIQYVSPSFSLRQLLLFIGQSQDMAISAQLVALLRNLMQCKQNGWNMCINRALLHSLAAQIPRLPEDVDDLSIFEDNKERVWAMMGALQVLGASEEVLYNGAPVSVMASEVDGQTGYLDWYRPMGGSPEIARVSFFQGNTRSSAIIQKHSELMPRPAVEVPVESILRPERIMALLVALVQQHVNLSSSSPSVESARAACLHEVAKARASQVVDLLLRDNPKMVQLFVSNGHLQAVTSLLAAPRGRFDDVPLRVVQRRFLHLELHRRKLDIGEAPPVPSSPHNGLDLSLEFDSTVDDEARTFGPSGSSAPSWICKVCSYRNVEGNRTCSMCFARVPNHPSVATNFTAANDSPKSPDDGDLLPEDNDIIAATHEVPSTPLMLTRNMSTASIRGTEAVLNAEADKLACNWSFEGGIVPEKKRGRVRMVREPVKNTPEEPDDGNDHALESDTDDSEEGDFLRVPNLCYLQFEHTFGGNGSEGVVYLNQYSIILDVRVPQKSMDSSTFVALLQTNLNNDSLADWYIKSDGSVGCIEYSRPNMVKPDTWNRLVMTADLTQGEICFYVNGSREVLLQHQGPSQQILILEDDRWAVDSSFCMFRDMNQKKDAPAADIARLQLRSYVMSPSEVACLGGYTEDAGIPMPDPYKLAARLSTDLKLPKAWCVRALEATEYQLPRARNWLRANEQALIARTVAEARMLTALGYSRKMCAHAICTTSSLSDAIHWLLENEDVSEEDLSSTRIINECCKDDADNLASTDILAINLAEDDQDAHNRTYEIYARTSASAEASSGVGSSSAETAQIADQRSPADQPLGQDPRKGRNTNRLSMPPLGCGLRQVNAEIWETARQIFVSYARQATVSILENSLMVQSELSSTLATTVPAAAAAVTTAHNFQQGPSNLFEDMQEKLLAMDGSGRNFLRNYIRAFPDSIRKDIRSGTISQEIDHGDPIQVLRRKLLLVFAEEVSRASHPATLPSDVDWADALEAWLHSGQGLYRDGPHHVSTLKELKSGLRVWWVEDEGDGQLIHEGTVQEVVLSNEHDIAASSSLLMDDKKNTDSAAGKVVNQTNGTDASSQVSETQPGDSRAGARQDEFQQLARVLYDFEPQRPGDLSIKKGDMVVVLGATKSGWGRAKELKTGSVGLIPLNYVDAIGGQDAEAIARQQEQERAKESALQKLQQQQEQAKAKAPANEKAQNIGAVEETPFYQAIVLEEEVAGVPERKRRFHKASDLLIAPPPTSANDKRIVKALRLRAEEELWRASVLRSLAEDVLHELVLLARGPWQFLPGGLQAGPSVQFQEAWNDKKTRVEEQTDPLTKRKKEVTVERGPSVRIWRPFADAGFYILGDVATAGTTSQESDQPAPVTVVSDDDGMGGKTTTTNGLPLLVAPARFRLIWQNLDTGDDEPVSLWQPVAPEGYVALGCIAVKGHSRREPDPKREGLHQLRCVHRSCVQLSTLQHGLWSYRPEKNKQGTDPVKTVVDSGRAGDSGDTDDSGRRGGSVRTYRAPGATSNSSSASTGGGNIGLAGGLIQVGSARRATAMNQEAQANASRRGSSTNSNNNNSRRSIGVSIWEIDNSSRTFVPVLAKEDQGLFLRHMGSMQTAGSTDSLASEGSTIAANRERNREKSKLMSLSRVDAGTIESRMCIESKKKSSEEETKTHMLHGLEFTTKFSVANMSTAAMHLGGSPPAQKPPQNIKMEEELRPYHLGLASTTNSNHGSSELLLWILQLLSEFDSNEKNGMGPWAGRVFSPQLVHALLRFSRTASPSVRIKAIRMLAMVIRRTPADSLRGKLGHELLELRVQMESLYKRQAQKPKDGLMDEMPLFSSLLCALAEVFVSVSLTQRKLEQGAMVPTATGATKSGANDTGRKSHQIENGNNLAASVEKSGGEDGSSASATLPSPSAKTKPKYFTVEFDGPLGIEILSNKDILLVHHVKENGAAAESGVEPGDIFWELKGRRISDYDRHEMWSTIKVTRPLRVTFLRDCSVKSAAARDANGDSAGVKEGVGKALASPSAVQKKPEEIDDPLTSKENWFQQLSELAAIMDALVDRDRMRMPSEFLMAEDTFLKLVMSSNTAIVESAHPYSSKRIKGEVTLPGAEALVVRFDRRCSTSFGKTLVLTCDAHLHNKQIRNNLHVEALQGCFGGTSVHVPASTMHYEFPVPQSMDWSFFKTPDYKAPEIRVTNNGRTATLRKDKMWQTIFTTTGFSSGVNSWEVRVDRTGPSANIFFGVAMRSAKVSNYLGSDDKGWGWIGCMACWHGGRKIRHRFGKRLKAGDVVRVTLDIPRRCMSLAVNGEDWGVAFNRLPLPSTILQPGNELVPTFSFYNKDDQISLLSGGNPMDHETATILHQLRSSFEQQHATARIASRQNNSSHGDSSSSSSSRRSSRRSGRSRTGASSSSGANASANAAGSGVASGISSLTSRRPSMVRRSSRRRRWSDADQANSGAATGNTSTNESDADRLRGHESSEDQSGNDGATSGVSQVEENAVILSALGYPVEWCVQALAATNHDMNRAAEYLITHSDRMAEESKQDAERRAAEAEEQVLAEEEGWLNHVNQLLDMDQVGDNGDFGDDDDGASATAAAAVAALQTAASNRIIQREYTISSAGVSDDDAQVSNLIQSNSPGSQDGLSQISARRAYADRKRGTSKEWGYRMTISPLYSRETTKRIALEPRNAARLELFHQMFAPLTLDHDCELVRLVNAVCSKRGEDPLTLSPNDLEPTDEELMRYKLLENIPLLTLQLRFLLLRNFNRRLAHVLPLVDLSCATHESALAAALRNVRGVVMSSVKKALFERVLTDSHSGDDHWMQQNKVPTVTLDRNKAAQFLKSGRVDLKGTRTVFGQLFSQLHGNGSEEKSERNPLLAPTPAVQDASLLRNSHRAWYTILAGERADDYGGPYRDVFNQACQELLTPALPLFVPCPNQVANEGDCRGKWLPVASATSHIALRMFEFVGKLMGIAMRTKNPFVLDMPSFVWKQLCSDNVTLDDVFSFDLGFFKLVKAVREAKDEEEMARLDLKFTMKGSDGRIVELLPGGNATPVTIKRRDDFLRALARARIHELDRPCAAIARGLATQVPRNLLSIFTSQELELMVCGPPEVDIDILKANTIYGDGVSETTPSVQLFWQVLHDFSQEDRQRYLRFVWGRSRLPSSSQDWDRKHKISKLSVRNSLSADKMLPTAHTCFFSLDLPMYTSKETCAEKLLYAVTHCIAIDMDETTVARNAADIQSTTNNRLDDDDDDEDM